MDIKTLREKYNLTQAEFADKMGVSWRTVQNWESGSIIPSTRRKKIEELFGGGDVQTLTGNSDASISVAPTLMSNTSSTQQLTLDKIYEEIAELRRLMLNDCTAKDAVIKELLALLKK